MPVEVTYSVLVDMVAMPVISKFKRRKICALLLCSIIKDLDDETDLVIERKCCLRQKTSNIFTTREREGVFKLLITKHLLDDETKFIAYFRFTREQFCMLVSLVEEDLKSEPCNRVKRPISPAEKVALTLRYLATGESYKSLAFSYRISSSYISVTIPKALFALKEKLIPLYLPSAHALDWVKIAHDFWNRWRFANVVGAIDGKHVRIVAPDNSASLYYNYKHYFSIVLLALVDANYKFLAIDVGSYGKEGDAGIFKKSKMGQFIDNGDATFPPPQYLPNSNIVLPHVVLGDEAFRLDKHLMKPFCKKDALVDQEKRNFNYNLCKVRRVSENCFGIMCNTFRFFFTPINAKPETVDLITIVSCCLHNLLRDEFISKINSLDTQDITYDLPVHNMIPLAGKGGFAKAEGFKVRSRFVEYFKNKTARLYLDL